MASALVRRDSYGYMPLGMRVLMRLLVSRKQHWGSVDISSKGDEPSDDGS